MDAGFACSEAFAAMARLARRLSAPYLHGFIISALVVVVAITAEYAMGIV